VHRGYGAETYAADQKDLSEPGLLGHVAVSEYRDHLPPHHQQEIYQYQGVEFWLVIRGTNYPARNPC